MLSPSTEAYDRGEKLSHDQQISSLDMARDTETARLRSLGCELPLAEVYLDRLAS